MLHLVPKEPEKTPYIFTKEGQEEVVQAIDKGFRYAKIFLFVSIFGGASIVGLLIWVIIHFLRKAW